MKTKSLKRIVTMMLALLLAVGTVLTIPNEVQAATKPTKITLSASKMNLTVGQTKTLKVKSVTPKKASTKVTFKTSNKKVATVTSKGVITAKKAGTATITVTSSVNKKVKATCKVTVKAPKAKAIVVTNAVDNTVSVRKGKTLTLKTALTPNGAVNKGFTYTVKDKKIATVNSKGKITAKKAGKTTITIKAKGTKLTKKITVIVPKVVVKSVKLNKTKTTLDVGKTVTLKATVNPSKASTKIVNWKSSNEKVATVTSKGRVTAKKAGNATITVTTLDGSKKATCRITVTTPVTSVTLNKKALNLQEGASEVLTATVAPTNATNKTVTWKSSDTTVATVSNGTVTAVKAGTAVITATSANGKSASCSVTVSAKTPDAPDTPDTPNPTPTEVEVTSVSLNAASKTIYANETLTLRATVMPTDATDKSITWTSSNTAVAAVDANGKVTPKDAGQATITATSKNGKIASCVVTVIGEEKASSMDDYTFRYTLSKSAESYRFVYNNSDKNSYSVSKSAVESEINTYAGMSLTNEVVIEKFHNLSNNTVKNSAILGLFAGKINVKTVSSDVKAVTVTNGSRTVTLFITIHEEDDELWFEIVNKEKNKTVQMRNVVATNTESTNKVTAVAKMGSQSRNLTIEIQKDGRSGEVKLNDGKLLTYDGTGNAYGFVVNKTYYKEILDMVGVDGNNKGLAVSEVYNNYFPL